MFWLNLKCYLYKEQPHEKIDAHAHLGYIGGWANIGMDADELISLMDTYEIEIGIYKGEY